MKKVFITLCVIMLTAVSVFAGNGKERTRYYAPKFSQGWLIDVSGTYSIFAGNNTDYSRITTYYGWGGKQFGYSVKVGRRVGPSTIFRLGYDWHPSCNQNGDFNFMSIHIDAMESIQDVFLGYNPDRFFTLWIYGGLGILSCGEPDQYFFGWRNNLEYGFHGGFMNSFRLNNSFDLHVDLTAVSMRWSYDSQQPDHINLLHRSHFDFSGMVGLMWYIGGRRLEEVKNEVVEADYTEHEARISELTNQVASLQDQLANCGNGETVITHDTIVKFIEGENLTYPFSIFFNKGSYELRDGRDLVNLGEFANAAKANGYKIVLRGTCDSATASASFNRTLAENRCNKIKAELVKLGVPESNITINPVGGVKELTPTEYDRRVLIQLSK